MLQAALCSHSLATSRQPDAERLRKSQDLDLGFPRQQKGATSKGRRRPEQGSANLRKGLQTGAEALSDTPDSRGSSKTLQKQERLDLADRMRFAAPPFRIPSIRPTLTD